MHEHAHELIAELPQWNNGEGIDLPGFIGCVGRYDHAIGYATIFWPDFVIYEDCICVAPPDPVNFRTWLSRFKGNRTETEKMINHLHIADLFVNSEYPPTGRILHHMGKLLQDMWGCRLRRDFPERQISVQFFEDDAAGLTDGYIITVWQTHI